MRDFSTNMKQLLHSLLPPLRQFIGHWAEHPAVRNRGRHALVLAAAIAVPAMAAPAEWSIGNGAQDQAEQLAQAPEVMPFEQAGMSFPGSAFYYLEDTPEASLALPALDPAEAPVEPARLGQRIDAGPAASPFTSAGTGLDKARALRCLTQAVYYEAASESEAGQRAVAQVVLNRVAHSTWPSSVCGVVFEGSQRSTGCQFTFTCDGSLRREPSRQGWDRAQRVAARALAGEVFEPIGLATHYHTNWVNPYWAKTLDHVGTIGAHRFYRWRGSAGKSAAFANLYTGGETFARAATGTSTAASGSASEAPIAARPSPAYSAATSPAPVASSIAPQAADALPYAGAGQVKQEYANAGQWIAQPE